MLICGTCGQREVRDETPDEIAARLNATSSEVAGVHRGMGAIVTYLDPEDFTMKRTVVY